MHETELPLGVDALSHDRLHHSHLIATSHCGQLHVPLTVLPHPYRCQTVQDVKEVL